MAKQVKQVKRTGGIIDESEAKLMENMPPSVVSTTVQHKSNEENLPKHQRVNKKVSHKKISTVADMRQKLCNAGLSPIYEKRVRFRTTQGDETDAPPVMDYLLGKDISASDRINVIRRTSKLTDDDFVSLVQPFVREHSNDGDALFENMSLRPKYLCVSIQMLNLTVCGRQHVLDTQNAVLTSHNQLNTYPRASYCVVYEVPHSWGILRESPWTPKIHRVCSKRVIRDKVHFGQSLYHKLPTERKDLQELFNQFSQSNLNFKVYSRYLNQRVPSLIGDCVVTLVGIRESETLSKEVELPLYGHKYMILGFLSVKLELVPDKTGFRCIRHTLPTTSLQVQTKPKQGLIKDRGLLDQPISVAEKSGKISVKKKQVKLPSQILRQVLPAEKGLSRDRVLHNQPNAVAEKSDRDLHNQPNAVAEKSGRELHNQSNAVAEKSDRDLHNQPNAVAEKSDRDLHNQPNAVAEKSDRTSCKQKQVILPRQIVRQKVLLHGLLYIAEGRGFKPVTSVLLSRGFWKNDLAGSNVCSNTSIPEYNFCQVIPVELTESLLNRCYRNFLVTEVWTDDGLLGIGKLPLDKFYIAFSGDFGVEQLKSSKYPVICVDGWVDVVALTNFQVVGQLLVFLAIGTKDQMLYLLSKRKFRLQRTPPPSPVPLDHTEATQLSELDTKEEKFSELSETVNILSKQHTPHEQNEQEIITAHFSRGKVLSSSGRSQEIKVKQTQSSDNGTEKVMPLPVTSFSSDEVQSDKPQRMPQCHQHEHGYQKVSLSKTLENIYIRFELGLADDERHSSFSSEPLKQQLRVPVISSNAEGVSTSASEYQGHNKAYYISKTDLANRQQPCDSENLYRNQQLPSSHRQKQCIKSCICQSKHSIGTNTGDDLDVLKEVSCFRNDETSQIKVAPLSRSDKSTNTDSVAKEDRGCESISGTTSDINPVISFIGEDAMTQTQLDDINSFHVLIEVEGAIHLPLLDNGMPPNPYVTFQVDHGLGSTTVASPVVIRSTKPTWQWRHETWLSSQLLLEESKCLIMKVWNKVDINSQDADITEDIVIGFVAVDLSVLLYGLPQIRGWFNINDLTGHCKGQIKINVAPLETLTRFENQTVNIVQSCYTEGDQPRKDETQHLNVHGAGLSPLNDMLKPCKFASIQNVLETDPKMSKEAESSEFEGIDQANEPLYVITEKHRKILPSSAAVTKTTNIEAATALTMPVADSDDLTLNSDLLGDKFADKSLPFLSETLKQTLSEMDEITKRLKKRLETVIHKEDNPVSCYSYLKEETDTNYPKISCDMLPLHAATQLCGNDSKCVDSNVGNRNDQFRKSQSEDPQRVVYTKYPFRSSQKPLDIKYGVPHQREKATSEEGTEEKQVVPVRTPSSSVFRQEEGAVGGSSSTDCLMQMAAEEDGLENIFNPMLFQHLLSCCGDTYQGNLGTASGIHVEEEKQHVAFPYRGGQDNFITRQIEGKIVGNDMTITHNLECDISKSNPIAEHKNQTLQSKSINQTYYAGDISLSSTKRLVNTGPHLVSSDAKAQVTRYLSLLHNEHRPYLECDTKSSSPTEAIIKESRQESNLALRMGFTNHKERTIMPSLSELESSVEVHSVSPIQAISVETDSRELEMSSFTTSTTSATLPQPAVTTITTTTTTTRQEDTMCAGRSRGDVHQSTPLLIDEDEIRRIAKIFNPRMKDSHTY